MLELAKINNAKILLASSSEIYGNPQINPQSETYTGCVNTTGLRSCYEEGKRVSETLCSDYRRVHNLQISIIRIFNTLGPKMSPDDGRVISNFIVQAIHNNDITIYGDGKQTRSFCYVSDLVDGLVSLMNSDYEMPVNLGNPDEYSIIDFAEIIAKYTNSDSKIIFIDLPIDDPKQRCPDISKAKKELDWQPVVNLEKGLSKTVNWFKEVTK